MFESTEPSPLPLSEPLSVRPMTDAVAPSIAAQQPRSSESAPQPGSRSPLIPPGGNAHYASEACPAFVLPSTEAETTTGELHRWARLRMRRAQYCRTSASQRRKHAPSRWCSPIIFRSFRRAATRTMRQRPATPSPSRPSRGSSAAPSGRTFPRQQAASALQRGRKHWSFRLVSDAHDRSDAWLAFILRSTEPSRLRQDEPHRWTRSRMPSRQVLQPSSFSAVRARPNVGRDCRSFHPFRQASDAIGQRPDSRSWSIRPSRVSWR
jgi:hypothetical protein